MFHSFAQVALSPSTARLVGYVVANTLTVFTHFRKKEEESSSMRTIYYQEVPVTAMSSTISSDLMVSRIE